MCMHGEFFFFFLLLDTCAACSPRQHCCWYCVDLHIALKAALAFPANACPCCIAKAAIKAINP
jgi:hypothetical protein